MANVDERVVAMAFENTKFEAAVATTHGTLIKLDKTIASLGKVNGLENIEKAASKVTLHGPMSALDKLKSKLGLAGQGAAHGFSEIDRAGNRVTLSGPMRALDNLRSRLFRASDGAPQAFSNIEKASSKTSLRGLNSALDSVGVKISGLQSLAAGAFGYIGAIATQKAGGALQSLSFGAVTGGFNEYVTNLRSIQTILSNTEQAGTTLDDVEKALKELNRYSDQTIYNFGQMADAVGLFTSAGVDLGTSVSSIKGIANLTALGGKDMEQARSAMVQLSQAVASGKVDLQTWNTLVNSGIAGPKFQQGLVRNAVQMGKLDQSMVKTTDKMGNLSIRGESFRNSVMAKPGEESWLTSKVLTQTLKQFTGDMSDAQLAAQGFNDDQIAAIQKSAQAAKLAATQVRDLKGVFGVASESIGSGWSETFQIIFGGYNEAKKTFTDLSDAVQKVLGRAANARNKILEDWKKLGGRTALIEGIKNIFQGLASVLDPIRDAFRDIFPRKTGQDLFELTQRFKDFTETLKIGPETAENLKRTFRGFFALLSIGKTIAGAIIGVLFDLFGVVGEGSGGFLSLTGSIGDFLVALDNAISKGDGLKGVFAGLENVLRVPIEFLKAFADALGSIFEGGGDKEASGQRLATTFVHLTDALGPLGDVLKAVVKIWGKFFTVFQKIADFVQPILEDVRDVFASIGDKIIEGLESVSYDDVLNFIRTTLIGGIAVGIKKLLGGIGIDLTGGLVNNLKEVLSTLSGTLKTIQQNIKARTILLIAAAVLALAGAAAIFAQIDPKKLGKAMTTIAIAMAELVGAMSALTKIGGATAFLQLPLIATSMLILAAAIDVLAIAVLAFSKMSWEGIAKGMAGVAGSIVAVGLATKLMGPSIILVGPGLLAVSAAVSILAVAMKIFGTMKWEEIAKGVVALGLSMAALGLGLKLMGPSLILVGPGLIAASIGLTLLAGAVSSFGSMDILTLVKGILGSAAALVILGTAVSLIPPTIALQAAGLVILAVALSGIAVAVGIMGNMGIGTIAKGLIGLGAALLILAVGLTAMSGTLVGAAALMGAALAFAVLVPTLVSLGIIPWSIILKGLAAMGVILGALAIAGLIVTGPITGLGIALAALGAGAIVVATSIYILAKAFSLLGDQGAKGVSVMIAALTGFIALLPSMVIDFVKGLVQILEAIVKLAPKIAENLVKILITVFDGLIKIMPKAAQVISTVLTHIIQIINQHAVPLINAGIRLFLGFLSGIAQNIGQVTTTVGNIIIRFLTALAEKMPGIIAAGANLLVKFLNGITSKLPGVLAAGARLIITFLRGMSSHIGGIVRHAATLITKFLNAVANNLPRMIRAGANVIVKFIQGVANNLPRIIHAGANLIISFIRGIANELPRIVDAGFKAIIKFLHGIAKAIRENDDALIDAGADILDALVDGVVKAAGKAGGAIKRAIEGLFGMLPGWAKKILGIHSPSKVFEEIGRLTMEGFTVGVDRNGNRVIRSMDDTAKDVVNVAKDALKNAKGLGDIWDADPVIRPVLDLTKATKDADRFKVNLRNLPPISLADGGFRAASTISLERAASEAAKSEAEFGKQGTVLNFEQHNHSPESLSDAEIYRRTRNQLSEAKDKVGLPNR